MRLTIVQYAGDYGEAFWRLAGGGLETYQAQRYSVDYVGSLCARLKQVSVVCAVTEETSDEALPNGVRAIGAGLREGFRQSQLLPFIKQTNPDRLILMTPLQDVLRWAATNQIPTLVVLADSFEKKGLRAAVRYGRLARLLNKTPIQWVANHGIGACLSLARIRVNLDKVIPWDWPPSYDPRHFPVRRRVQNDVLSLLYVGLISESKGVGDLLHAVALLRRRDRPVNLVLVGEDRGHSMRAMANQLGLTDQVVQFAGKLPNQQIPAAMLAADCVVIPSRHEYPEGLPLTIYEALATRTPIIASDHPMFRGALTNGQSAVIFEGSSPQHLADAIVHLGADDALYELLSENAERAWQRLQLPVRWADLLEAWLFSRPEELRWMREHTLGSGRYTDQIADRVTPSNSARLTRSPDNGAR